MKKTACVLISLLLMFSLSGCITIRFTSAPSPEPPSVSGALPETTAAPIPDPTVLFTASPVPAVPPLTVPLPTSAPEGPEIYSSYAHMVSLDVARGVADFDYFDMLRGADAVEWLVEHEGYSEADAQAAVAEFADSEFIEKNTNPQIRHIDLTDIPLKLMFRPDGTMVEGAEPVDSEYADMYVLYELDRSLVLDTFFYYITAEDGEAVSVEQVYWP
jgi:hypothetical protein